VVKQVHQHPGTAEVSGVDSDLGSDTNRLVRVGGRRSRNLALPFVALRRLFRVVYATIDDVWRTRRWVFDPPVAPLTLDN
jgi:hypothetical protein